MQNGHKVTLLAPDLAKAFGIALVVFGHTLRGLISTGVIENTSFWLAVDKGIYLFHMPLFFFLSGIFYFAILNDLGIRKTIIRHAMLLLIPLLIWSYIQSSVQFFAGDNVNNRQNIQSVLSAPLPPKQQFWFLGSLFMIMAAVGLIYASRFHRQILFFVMLLILFVNAVFMHELTALSAVDPWAHLWVKTWVHFPYFALGCLMPWEKFKNARINSLACLFIFAVAIAAYLSLPWAQGFILIIASISCVLCIYKFMQNIEKNIFMPGKITRFFVYVGMNSMIIYLAHVIFSAGTRTLLLKLGIVDAGTHLSAGTMVGLFAPLLLVPIGFLWSNYHPALARACIPVRQHR